MRGPTRPAGRQRRPRATAGHAGGRTSTAGLAELRAEDRGPRTDGREPSVNCPLSSVLCPPLLHSPLTLPRFSEAIPSRLRLDSATGPSLQIAKALAYGGVLKPEHLLRGTLMESFGFMSRKECIDNTLAGANQPRRFSANELSDAIERAMKAWTEPYLGKLFIYTDLVPELTVNLRDTRSGNLYDVDATDIPAKAALALLTTQIRTRYFIGGAVKAWEKMECGMGDTLLDLIWTVAGGIGPTLYGPSEAMDSIIGSHWHGEEDEREAIAMNRYENGDGPNATDTRTDEEVAKDCDILTRKQVDATLPEIAWKRWGKKKRPRYPVFHARAGRWQGSIKAANQLSAHLEVVEKRFGRPNRERCPINEIGRRPGGTPLSSPLLLCWAKNDPVARAADDDFEGAQQTGESDIDTNSLVTFEADDPADCIRAVEKFTAILETTKLLDRLLTLTTETDDEEP